MKQLLLFAVMLLTFSGITLFLFTFQQDEKRFDNITSRIFTDEMSSNTINMHYTLARPEDYGIYDYRPILPRYSSEGVLRGQAATENTLAALKSLDQRKLTDSDAGLCRLLIRSLESSLALGGFTYYSEPLSPSSGSQTQLPILLAEYAFRSTRDVEDYLALLEQTDDYFASLLTYEQEKAAAGLSMPASFLREVRQQCDTIITGEALENGSHFLQATFRERLEGLRLEGLITEAEFEKYLGQNDRLLKTVLLPAYTALGDGLLLLEDESIPLEGLAARPQGKAYYEALLKAQTGSDRSVPEIQELLTGQFTREYDLIRELAARCPEAARRYAEGNMPAFPYTSVTQMLADLKVRMEGSFPELAGSTASLAVKPVSSSLAEYCAPAFYLTAPLDDTDHNVIYINQQKTPYGLELYTTLAHEGYPGHLYQTVYANRQALSNGDRPVKQLLWYGGYTEGWALYVEFLSFDYAAQLFQERQQEQDALLVQIEKHNRSMQLCLYSMLDIMIHYDGASYSQIAQVLEGFGVTDSDSAKAVYTYIIQSPCNYLKYYLGYLEIQSLQEKAVRLWGDEYTDLQFHRFLLDSGPADFTALTRLLEKSAPSPREGN